MTSLCFNILFVFQSVQFHENGKRHKAAVEAKIKEIGKKSVADKKAKDKMDDDIRKMEEVNEIFLIYCYLSSQEDLTFQNDRKMFWIV